MRFWSGAQVAFAKDYFGHAVLIQGEIGQTVRTAGTAWKLDQQQADGTRIWRPVDNLDLHRLTAPAPDNAAGFLMHALLDIPPVGLHPALTRDVASEIYRLHPGISDSMRSITSQLCQYLEQTFQYTAFFSANQSLEAYIDGFGPENLVKLGDTWTLLPELPPVYLAPPAWHLATWQVTNGMIGPAADTDIPIDKRLQFSGQPIRDLQMEGLVYYQSVRAMLAWAAWERDAEARFVKALYEIYTSGYRPLTNA
ncbi:MAG TPA: hypothetical protein VG842_05130 [Sediminibacterium sp.]|nr:hypothetical protein [Sediminibacterium sp.]